jgi:hypothetical protein
VLCAGVVAVEPAASLDDLIASWQDRDGAAFHEAGFLLSKQAVLEPEEFLTAMADHEEAFTSWIEGLQDHTFTVFIWEDGVDRAMATASLGRLKGLMAESIAPFAEHPRLGRHAETVLAALRRIDIRFVE